LEAIVVAETGGSPTSDAKWVRSSLRSLSKRLTDAGHPISPPTVGRLLRAQDYSLLANRKEKETEASHPERNRQFLYLRTQRTVFEAGGWPIVSVDTKKKELIGAFRNAGVSWLKEPIEVNVHDFLHDALGRAAPYGIYDLARNHGIVYVGDSADTSAFAVDCLADWWKTIGRQTYPKADRVLILADGGGSNGWRCRLWKERLQAVLCDPFGLSVTVGHYPTGCSKYNPIEHRLFGPISVNWAGKPLTSFEAMLAYIRGTTTRTGLTTEAVRWEGVYEKGCKVTDDAMGSLALERHLVCPNWNYTLHPRSLSPNLSRHFPDLIS
jgi:hypothetical protein